MLPAPNRLRRSRSFREATRLGARARGPVLVLHLWHSSQAEPPRVGFVVGRGVGSAVTRTLVKRRLRSLTRERLGFLAPGSILVVRALAPTASASYVELGTELDRGLARLSNGSEPMPVVKGAS